MERRPDRCAVTPYGRGAGSSRVRVFEWLDRIDTDFTVSGYLSLTDAAASRLVRHPLALARAELRLGAIARARPRRLLLHREASPLTGSPPRRPRRDWPSSTRTGSSPATPYWPTGLPSTTTTSW
jgi:hypothetical protein